MWQVRVLLLVLRLLQLLLLLQLLVMMLLLLCQLLMQLQAVQPCRCRLLDTLLSWQIALVMRCSLGRLW